MKKTITLITLLLLSLVGYSQTNEPTKTSIRNTDSQKIVREGDSLKLDNSPGIDLSDLKGSTLKKTSRDSIANLTQAQLLALGTRFVTATVADVVSGGGSAIPVGFVSPRAYGAVMDGVTDDRDALVAALAANDKIWIDADMYLDCSAVATDVIYIDDNKTIKGNGNVKLTVLNDRSPVFHIPLSENVHFEGFTMEWSGSYDVLNYQADGPTANALQQGLENWLIANRGLTFAGNTNPFFNGGSVFRSFILIDGAQNVTVKDVVFKAKDNAGAHEFIPFLCKLKSQYSKDTFVDNEITAISTQPKNINFINCEIDGVLMGIQGNAEDLTIVNLVGKRYSDAQDASGNFIGGNNGNNQYTVAPPHLLYIVANQYDDLIQNVKIINTIDYGIYVGSPNVRATESGMCNSLTMGAITNLIVDGYKSYRRDGFAGIVNPVNGVFKNIYSESYNSQLFSPTNNDFSSLRLNGSLENCFFSNIIIKDLSPNGIITPITSQNANNTIFENVHLYSTGLTDIPRNFISFFGNNNKVVNSGLNIENFAPTRTNIAPIAHNTDTRANGTNNYYDIYIKGWRPLGTDEQGNMFRSDLLVLPSNTNPNYYKITDVDNNYYVESDAGITKTVWTLSALMTVGTGTNSRFSIDAYDDWLVKKIKLQTISSLGTGTTYSLGTGGAAQTAWLPTFNATAGSLISRNINEVTPDPSNNRPLFLFSNAAMNGTGQIKLTMELEKYQEGNNVTILND